MKNKELPTGIEAVVIACAGIGTFWWLQILFGIDLVSWIPPMSGVILLAVLLAPAGTRLLRPLERPIGVLYGLIFGDTESEEPRNAAYALVFLVLLISYGLLYEYLSPHVRTTVIDVAGTVVCLLIGYRMATAARSVNSLDGLDGSEKLRMAEKIKSYYGDLLATSSYGSNLPMSALHPYSFYEVKEAIKLLAISSHVSEEYRSWLRTGFIYLSDIYEDDDFILYKRFRDHDNLNTSEEDRLEKLRQLHNIRYERLGYEWDEWLLLNGITLVYTHDDIKQGAAAMNLTLEDLRDIEPGEIPSCEQLALNRRKRDLLSRVGPDVNKPDNSGVTPLMAAAYVGDADAVRILLNAGADMNIRDRNGFTPLILAERSRNEDALKVLLQAGADTEATDSGGATALIHASWDGNENEVAILLDAGANTEAWANDGITPLMGAAAAGHIGAVKRLLEAGANIEAASADGVTSLIAATFSGHIHIAEMLLAAGANKESKEKGRGGTSLHLAASLGYADFVNTLVEAGADIEARDDYGDTPLAAAAEKEQTEIVTILISYGVDVDTSDNAGYKLLSSARASGHQSVVDILIAAGAKE